MRKLAILLSTLLLLGLVGCSGAEQAVIQPAPAPDVITPQQDAQESADKQSTLTKEEQQELDGIANEDEQELPSDNLGD